MFFLFFFCFFFFNDTATTEIYTLSLHDALPIYAGDDAPRARDAGVRGPHCRHRSEEHTSELQSRFDLVCRLLLEKKKKQQQIIITKNKQHKLKEKKTTKKTN